MFPSGITRDVQRDVDGLLHHHEHAQSDSVLKQGVSSECRNISRPSLAEAPQVLLQRGELSSDEDHVGHPLAKRFRKRCRCGATVSSKSSHVESARAVRREDTGRLLEQAHAMVRRLAAELGLVSVQPHQIDLCASDARELRGERELRTQRQLWVAR